MQDEYEMLVRDSIPDFLYSMKHHLTHSNPERVIWYWKYLSLYLYTHGRIADLIECESYALAAAKQNEAKDQQEAQQIQVIAALRIAQAYLRLRDLDRAEVYLKQAEANWQSFNAGDLVGPADFLRYEAELAYYRENFDKALEICQQALDLTDKAEAQLQSHKGTSVPEIKKASHRSGTISITKHGTSFEIKKADIQPSRDYLYGNPKLFLGLRSLQTGIYNYTSITGSKTRFFCSLSGRVSKALFFMFRLDTGQAIL